MFRIRGSLSSRAAPVALPVLVVVWLMIAAADWRAGALAALVVLAFVGMSAIQFHERHFYYLQFVPWFAFGLLVQWLVHRARPAPVAPALAAAGVAIVLSAGAVIVTRAIQQRSVERLLSTYERSHRTPLRLDQRHRSTGTLLSTPEWSSPLGREAPRVSTRVLAIELDASKCGTAPLAITERYDATVPDADLSRTWHLAADTPSTAPTMFVIAYDRADESIRFRGIEIPSDRTACIARVSRVDDLGAEPLLLHAFLVPGWREEPLYQRLQ